MKLAFPRAFNLLSKFSRNFRRTLAVDVIPLNEGLVQVRSSGLRRSGLPEVEVSSCPHHLTDVAIELVRSIACNGLSCHSSLMNGKTVGGRFVHSDQVVVELFRLVSRADDPNVLQIVDVAQDRADFPHRLFATHLYAAAGRQHGEEIRLLLVSVETWPLERVASVSPLPDYELNPNNFWSWTDLGTRFSQAGMSKEAFEHWKNAVCMWPRGGKMYAAKMLSKCAAGRADGDVVDSSAFWRSVNDDNIREWCEERNIILPESALLDYGSDTPQTPPTP